jgi:hypothetical protein
VYDRLSLLVCVSSKLTETPKSPDAPANISMIGTDRRGFSNPSRRSTFHLGVLMGVSFREQRATSTEVEVRCDACKGKGVPAVKQPRKPTGRRIYPAPCAKCGGKSRLRIGSHRSLMNARKAQ